MSTAGRFLRIPAAATGAAVVTLGLFLVMQYLITAGAGRRGELETIAQIRFGRVVIPEEIVSRSRRKPPPPPPLPEKPPTPRLPETEPRMTPTETPQATLPDLELPLSIGSGPFVGTLQPTDPGAEGEVIPVVVIRPMYPRDAALSGIEGWVRVEFTITATGSVKDAQVVDAQPPRVFNREALRAILKWKFKPRVVDGVAVERRATQVIDFNLDH